MLAAGALLLVGSASAFVVKPAGAKFAAPKRSHPHPFAVQMYYEAPYGAQERAAMRQNGYYGNRRGGYDDYRMGYDYDDVDYSRGRGRRYDYYRPGRGRYEDVEGYTDDGYKNWVRGDLEDTPGSPRPVIKPIGELVPSIQSELGLQQDTTVTDTISTAMSWLGLAVDDRMTLKDNAVRCATELNIPISENNNWNMNAQQGQQQGMQQQGGMGMNNMRR